MMESYSREFTDIIKEAEQLKHDLNIMMENVVDISRTLVDDLDAKVAKHNSLENEIDQNRALLNDNKLRVYELAQELNMNSNQLLALLTGLGYDYSSHMNILDDNTVQIVKNFLSFKMNDDFNISKTSTETNQDTSIEHIKNAHPYIAVRVLHEKGYSIKEIAKILERGQGEVNLLLNLSKKSKVI